MRRSAKLDAEMARRGYVSLSEAARRACLSERTIYKAVREGELPFLLAGSHRYVSLVALAAYGGPGVALLLGVGRGKPRT